jgi:hypothetical protein
MNSESKATGALMRAASLAVCSHKLAPSRVAEYAAVDASLSHPNPTCGECSAAHSIAAAHLIAHPGDARGAYAAACTWASAHAGKLRARACVGGGHMQLLDGRWAVMGPGDHKGQVGAVVHGQMHSRSFQTVVYCSVLWSPTGCLRLPYCSWSQSLPKRRR